MPIRIETVEISAAMVSKIAGRHGVSVTDVEDACENVIKASWVFDEERGLRLLLLGRTSRGRVLRVVLYPIEGTSGEFRLGSAF